MRAITATRRVWGAAGVLLCVAGMAGATAVPINVSLAPGQTLYVRFGLTDMTNFPNPFNMFGFTMDFDQRYVDFSTDYAMYDDSDAVLGSGNVTAASGYGFGPTFADWSRGGRTNYPNVDLSSYDDGTGMVSYASAGGPTVFITTFEALFGQATQYGSYYPHMPYIYNFAIDAPPPALPEPQMLALLLGGTALLGRRIRRRPS